MEKLMNGRLESQPLEKKFHDRADRSLLANLNLRKQKL
jgi:hypothetical protein